MPTPPSRMLLSAVLFALVLAVPDTATAVRALLAPDTDWARLNSEWTKGKPVPELLIMAETAVEQYPLDEHPNMWAQLAGAYAILAKHGLNRGNYAQVKKLAEDYFRHEQTWDRKAPRNLLRACYLEAIIALEGAQRAAEIFDQYRTAEGAELWRWPGRADFALAAARALSGSGREADANALLMEALIASPDTMHYVVDRVYRYCKAVGDRGGTLKFARLGFAVCDYDDKHINQWSQRVIRTFTARFELAQADAFAQALTDPQTPNPLTDVPLPELTEEQTETLLRNAQGKPRALVHANLLLGRWDEALQAAGGMLSDSAPAKVDQAVRLAAKCFKAKDLNLTRANQFIEYSRTGEGENPVNTF